MVPTQKEKTTCQDRHHRQDVDHKVNENIARHIFVIRNKHFTRMLAKIQNSISVKSHNADWYILTKPPEELQDSSGISVAMLHDYPHQFRHINVFYPPLDVTMLHEHPHQLRHINVLYQPLDFGFLFFCHLKISFCL